MAYQKIPNPPNAPAGYVAEWTGSSWEVVPIEANIVPAAPVNLPNGYSTTWNGSEWVVAEPSPPPAPADITLNTIYRATAALQYIDFLATAEVSAHITQESRKAVADYIRAVANILAQAQIKLAAGEAYTPEFPAQPVVVHQQLTGSPIVQFVAGE